MIELVQPKVTFDEFAHTYTNELGIELSGVTSLLKRQLFADKYKGISDEVLAKAAERGNLIHRQIEMLETFHKQVEMHEEMGGEITKAPEVESYYRLKKKGGFITVATEFLVSDCFNVASSIDVIWSKKRGDKVWLVDIKTTSSLDKEYLSWQLSVYKYLFLLHNPDVEVAGLLAVWLPNPDKNYGLPKLVVIEEKPVEEVARLIMCYAKGIQYTNQQALVSSEEKNLAVPQEMTNAIANLLRAEKAAKDMRERLRDLMEQHGVTKWECDEFTATIGKPSQSSSFDSKALAKEDPDTYEKYLKTTEKKGSFTIKLK